MKSDVPSWVAVDEDINRLEMQVEYYKTVLDTLAEILKQVINSHSTSRTSSLGEHSLEEYE